MTQELFHAAMHDQEFIIKEGQALLTLSMMSLYLGHIIVYSYVPILITILINSKYINYGAYGRISTYYILEEVFVTVILLNV